MIGTAAAGKITTGYLNAINKLSEVSAILPELEEGSVVGKELVSKVNDLVNGNLQNSEKLAEVTK